MVQTMVGLPYNQPKLYSFCFRAYFKYFFFSLDIQLCPSRSDDYIPKLYYETNKFSAFDQLWTIKAKVIGNEKCATRSLSYQLILKGEILI